MIVEPTTPFNWRDTLQLVELLLLIVIVYQDWLMLQESRTARKLYEEFFTQRSRWYAARGKKQKPPVAPELEVLNEIVSEEETTRQEPL